MRFLFLRYITLFIYFSGLSSFTSLLFMVNNGKADIKESFILAIVIGISSIVVDVATKFKLTNTIKKYLG